MPRTKNVELMNRKKELINEVIKFAAPYAKMKPVKVDRFYEELPELHDVWRSKAYFIQELKKYAPPNVKIESSQRRGTYIKMKDEPTHLSLTMKNAISKETKEFIARVIDKMPENLKKYKIPKFIENQLDNVESVYKITDGYIVKTKDKVFEVVEVKNVQKKKEVYGMPSDIQVRGHTNGHPKVNNLWTPEGEQLQDTRR